jgi:hypothetical protein
MNWNDGDFAEELSTPQKDEFDQFPAYYCPWCKKETDLWFDRTITCYPNGTEIGMKDRCIECGHATDELPDPCTGDHCHCDSDRYCTPECWDEANIGEAENDGG